MQTARASDPVLLDGRFGSRAGSAADALNGGGVREREIDREREIESSGADTHRCAVRGGELVVLERPRAFDAGFVDEGG